MKLTIFQFDAGKSRTVATLKEEQGKTKDGEITVFVTLPGETPRTPADLKAALKRAHDAL